MSVSKFTFNFRPMTAEKIQNLTVDGKVNLEQDFEVVEKDNDGNPTKYKRKPLTVDLHLPEFADTLDDLAKRIITDFVANFVKQNYVDQFLPIGVHDWETIKAEAATSKGSSTITLSDDVLALTAASFGQYVTATTGYEQLGERVQGIVENKVTQSAVTKFMSQCDEGLVDKLLARAEQWAEHIAQSGDERADDLADGYAYIEAKLKKLKRKLSNDITDLVGEVL